MNWTTWGAWVCTAFLEGMLWPYQVRQFQRTREAWREYVEAKAEQEAYAKPSNGEPFKPATGIGWRAAGANLASGVRSAVEAAVQAEEKRVADGVISNISRRQYLLDAPKDVEQQAMQSIYDAHKDLERAMGHAMQGLPRGKGFRAIRIDGE